MWHVLPLRVLLFSRRKVSSLCVYLKGGGEVIVCKTGRRCGGGGQRTMPRANAEPLKHKVTWRWLSGMLWGLSTKGNECGNLGKDQRGRSCWQPSPSQGFHRWPQQWPIIYSTQHTEPLVWARSCARVEHRGVTKTDKSPFSQWAYILEDGGRQFRAKYIYDKSR